MSKELTEAVKEFVRTFSIGEVLTIIGVLGIIAAGINKELGTFVIQWNVAGALLVADSIVNIKTALGRALDKWLHEKDVRSPFDLRGLDSLIK